MHLALWNEPILDFFARSVHTLAHQLEIETSRQSRRACRDSLVLNASDVALVPTLTVFKEPELYDVLPAVAISSWQNPFLTLLLKEGLGKPPASVAIDPVFAQEALVAKILLKEHYGASPQFLPVENLEAVDFSATGADAAVVVSTSIEDSPTAREGIDIGRDWFELTHYPMVWGVFVMRKGEAQADAVSKLRDLARYTEFQGPAWLEEQSMPDRFRAFYEEGLRYRLDDLAVASLTSLQDYLYYNEAVEDMAPLPIYEVDEAEDDEEDQPLL